jgi:hypothetical protein
MLQQFNQNDVQGGRQAGLYRLLMQASLSWNNLQPTV